MTTVSITATGLDVHFPGWERLAAGRSTFHADPAAVLGATAEDGWTSEVLGVRSGMVVSGYRKVGTFRHPSGVRRLVSMKRGMPLLRVQLDRQRTGFDELLVSTHDAAAIAAHLRAALAARR